MPLISFDDLRKNIGKSKFAPLYLLHGEESYYIDQISDLIEEKALSPAEKGFNQSIFYGRDVDIPGVLNQARRFPMMASHQVIIVKEAQEMPDWRRAEAQDQLIHYAAQPQPSTILLWAYKHKTLAKNTKVYKALLKSAQVLEAKKLYENQVPQWIERYLKERKCEIEGPALALLVEAIGPDLARLHGELNKLLLNIPEDRRVSAALVEKNVGISRDFNAFEFQKALASRDAYKTEQIILYWSANPKKQALIPTLALLYSFFSKVLMIYHQKDRSDAHLSSLLKVPPFFLKDYRLMMNNYNLGQMLGVIQCLHEADLQSKGILAGGSQDADILRELCVKIFAQ